MMPLAASLEEALEPLTRLRGVEGAAVVARDGLLLASRLPAGVNRDTFGAMSATLIGAATTAAYEFRRRPPASLTIAAEAWTLLALEATDGVMVMAFAQRDARGAADALRATAARVAELLGQVQGNGRQAEHPPSAGREAGNGHGPPRRA